MMVELHSFSVWTARIPLRFQFRHGAAAHTSSSAIFVKCLSGRGTAGFGESSPREFVTGESLDTTFEFLRDDVLPSLVGRSFRNVSEVLGFSDECDGSPPTISRRRLFRPAAMCAVELAILDCVGSEGQEPIAFELRRFPRRLQLTGDLPFGSRRGTRLVALLSALFGVRRLKVKLGRPDDARRIAELGRLRPFLELHGDLNMAYSPEEALEALPELARLGVRSFEEPLRAESRGDLPRLRALGLPIVADESVTDDGSLDRLIDSGACAAVNLKISKQGGFSATLRRAAKARAAGLAVQLGANVGESSLSAAAELALAECLPALAAAETCGGAVLLRHDPGRPRLFVRPGGLAPRAPSGPGLGVRFDETGLRPFIERSATV